MKEKGQQELAVLVKLAYRVVTGGLYSPDAEYCDEQCGHYMPYNHFSYTREGEGI